MRSATRDSRLMARISREVSDTGGVYRRCLTPRPIGPACSWVHRHDPGVLAAAALRRVHDEGAAPQCDPSESAGGNPDPLALEDERAQIEMPRLDFLLHQRG